MSSLIFHVTQHVWCYAAYMILQILVKHANLGRMLFDNKLNKNLKKFHRIWLFLHSGNLWIIWRRRKDLVHNAAPCLMKKVQHVVWDVLINYKRI